MKKILHLLAQYLRQWVSASFCANLSGKVGFVLTHMSNSKFCIFELELLVNLILRHGCYMFRQIGGKNIIQPCPQDLPMLHALYILRYNFHFQCKLKKKIKSSFICLRKSILDYVMSAKLSGRDWNYSLSFSNSSPVSSCIIVSWFLFSIIIRTQISLLEGTVL